MATLAEQYRPQTLADVAGQDAAVREIQRVLARGWGSQAWWLSGPSGCGKTTLAYIIAAHGADEFATHELDASTLTPARLRDVEEDCRYTHLGEKRGKCFIVNEAHGLRKDTIRQLLVLLDRMPAHVVWVFTTTKEGQQSLFDDDSTGDAAPLLSRCFCIDVVSDDNARAAFARRAREIAVKEGIDGLPLSAYASAVSASQGNMRRLLQRIESGAFRKDARIALEREYTMIASTKGERAEKRRAELTAAIAACA